VLDVTVEVVVVVLLVGVSIVEGVWYGGYCGLKEEHPVSTVAGAQLTASNIIVSDNFFILLPQSLKYYYTDF
jgi:hypothetical protein|tara:strand:- start:853 stop:1068 length:216 start_codon:yes stop_codon:yes gene_type:complete